MLHKNKRTRLFTGQQLNRLEAIIPEDNQIFEIGKIRTKSSAHPWSHHGKFSLSLITKMVKTLQFSSGDTLFLGDVGEPDLAQKAANLLKKNWPGLCTIHYNKILPLADDIAGLSGS